MTTPTTPASSLSVSQVSDEINPASYVQGQQSVGANVVVRKLTGSFTKNRFFVGNPLEIGTDLSNKTAFSEIIAPSVSNTQNGISTEDVPLTSVLTLTANTDMFEPNVTWSFVINPDSVGVTSNDILITKNIVFDPVTNRPASKSANVKLTSLSGTKVANLTITGVISVPNYDEQGLFEVGTHVVNTCTKNINLTVNAVNTAFVVTATPGLVVNATGVQAQTATLTLTASSNSQLTGVTYKFTPSFVTGTAPLSPIINANSIVFTATAEDKPGGSTNTANYSVLTEMFKDGVKIRSNTALIDIRAQFIDRTITSLVATALSNNQFSNSASQYSTIDVTAIHDSVAPTYPQGTITFTLVVTGDNVTQTTLSSNSSSKTERITLYHNKDADGFGFKKASVLVTATLRSPDNRIMDQQTLSTPIVLRAGTYGLTLNKPPSNTQIGFAAQTATSVGTATWGAGDFVWQPRQFNGSGPRLSISDQPKTSTVNIVASTPSGKNASQTVSNTCNYDLTAKLSYDGITIVDTVLSDILISAQSQAYTYSISAAASSNVQSEIDSAVTSSIIVTGSASSGSITWTRDNSDVGLTTNSTAANVFVTSSSSGSSNNKIVAVTGTLRDGSSRLIEALTTQNIELDATTTKLQILGANVSISTDQKSGTATGVFESTCLFGSHSLIFPPVKQSGQDLELAQDSSTKLRIISSAAQSSKSGVYRITGRVDYRGIIRTTTKDVSVSVSALAPTLTYTKTPYSYTTYSEIGSLTGFGGEITGGIGSIAYFTYSGVDIVVETDYPGTINTAGSTLGTNGADYTIRRVVNILGDGPNTALLSGPFFNQTANLPIVNTTTGLPTGYPGSVNKRRDRVESTLLNAGFLKYNITYELYDASGNILISNTVSDETSVPPPGTGQVRLDFVSGTQASYTVTNKSNNGNGYPEPHPLQVLCSQTVSYSASYSSTATLPTPRFAFSFPNRPGDNQAANRVITANTINGQANVTVSSVYYDQSSNFSGTLPSITDSNGLNSLQVQLTSTDPISGTVFFLGEPKASTERYTVPMPPGRCYRLSTYSYGPRMYHTRDVFSNSSEVIDYSRIPDSNGFNGPETKFVGLHDGSTIYALSSRPLYGSNTKGTTRYYSSTAHRSAHGNETPNVIIPTGYFMIMSFSETGVPAIGAITFLGSDGKTYPCGALWAKSATSQNDTSRNNDAFDWFIYEPPVLPAGVTADYVFISNGGYIPPPPPADNISFTAVAPGDAYVGQSINLNIGTVSGGFVEEDLFRDPGNVF